MNVRKSILVDNPLSQRNIKELNHVYTTTSCRDRNYKRKDGGSGNGSKQNKFVSNDKIIISSCRIETALVR